MLRWSLFLGIFILLDYYAFQSLKTITQNHWLYLFYWLITLIVLGNFTMHFYGFERAKTPFSHSHAYALGFLIAIMVPQLVLCIILFGEDVLRVLQSVYQHLIGSSSKPFPSRRTFISKLALGLAALPFSAILYGIYRGKYNYKVLRYTLYFEDLPKSFDGYKITQISDIHSGSFDNIEKVDYAINLINEQRSDAILFTGDMVNNRADEMIPYLEIFSKLKAKDGLFSVLGNHDYGDYVQWDSELDKQKNLEKLKQIQKNLGFKLLLNEAHFIEKNQERLALIGVENWGAGGFKKAGDLKKATQNVSPDDFKILMSHDPSHWEKEVLKDALHYHLTLSGHTHGMQFGIEIPHWFKWSPVKWRYKYWAGVYKELGQYINVNRGFGYLAFPGRVGIWPEITVIELKRGTKKQDSNA